MKAVRLPTEFRIPRNSGRALWATPELIAAVFRQPVVGVWYGTNDQRPTWDYFGDAQVDMALGYATYAELWSEVALGKALILDDSGQWTLDHQPLEFGIGRIMNELVRDPIPKWDLAPPDVRVALEALARILEMFDWLDYGEATSPLNREETDILVAAQNALGETIKTALPPRRAKKWKW